MSSNPLEIGTLIVVVLKANHLPNKRHIGKQDPYCVVTVNGEKRRTKAIKRGGQHPEWDEEIRFTLYEDTEEKSDQKDSSPPAPPPKSTRKPKKIKGGMTMKVACFADDPREPDFIGEADVDLTEVLTKGETDEWFTLTSKEKFSGKVYLELTFWSNEPPPEKKAIKPQKANKYAGPGYFNPMDDQSQISSHSMISNGHEQLRLTDSVSSVLRVPNPKAQSELIYDPPYLAKHRTSTLDRVSSDFGELDFSDRRNSPQGGHLLNSSVSSGFSAAPTGQPTHSFDFSTTEQNYMHTQDRPITPAGPAHPPQPASVPSALQPGHNHDLALVNGPQHSNRRSRIPTSSSGFVPLHGPTGMPSHSSEAAGLAYNPTGIHHNTHYPMQPYTSALSQASGSTVAFPYAQNPVPPSFTPQSYQSPQLSPYSQYPPATTLPASALPAPTSSYVSTTAALAPQSQQMNPPYMSGNTPSPTHDQGTFLLQGHPSSLMLNNGSRPLPPQPQIAFGQAQIPSVYATSQVMAPQHTIQQNNGMYQPSVPFPSTQQPPLPPHPPHSVDYNTSTYIPDAHSILPPPPPPPPLSEIEQAKARTRRRSSLPRPPVNYIQPPPPPPPPLPVNNHLQALLPPPPPLQGTGGEFSHPGPPPKPPIMIDTQSQWLPSSAPQSLQGGYGSVVI